MAKKTKKVSKKTVNKTKKTVVSKAPSKAKKKVVSKKKEAPTKEKPAKKSTLGKKLIKGLKEAVKHEKGEVQLTTHVRELGRPIVKDPPEKSLIPEYKGSRSELFETIKTNVLKMKEEIISRMKQRQEEHDDVSAGSTGDEGDMAQALAEQSLQQSLTSNDEMRLKQIELVLEKMNKGTYGICIDTEEEIEAKRLLANPFALRSIYAQEEVESTQRLRKTSARGVFSAVDSEESDIEPEN